MDPWDHMKRGDYAVAVNIYSQRIREQGQVHYLLNLYNRALGYLNLADYTNALADFNEAERAYGEEPYNKRNNLRSDAYRQFIGVTLWLMGREGEAEETWAALLEDQKHELITSTDAAGGIVTPCLAWFAGCGLNNRSLIHSAETELDRKFTCEEAINWPGPLAPFILGRTTVNDLLQAATASKPLRDRHTCQAYFYIGVRARASGDVRKAIEMFRAASDTHAVLEREYYLAGREYNKISNVDSNSDSIGPSQRAGWWRRLWK